MNRSRDFLVGLVFFGLLIVLGIFTIFLADFRFGEVSGLTVSFQKVEGLEPGAGVRINGVRSGVVESVTRNPETELIDVAVKFEGDPRLYPGAKFEIKDLSMLGGKVLSITNGPKSDTPIDLSRTQKGEPQSDLFATVGAVAEELKMLIAENREDVGQAVRNIKGAAAEAEKLIAENRESLGKAIADISGFAAVLKQEGPGILTDIRGITADLRDEEGGTLGRLLRKKALADDLESVVADLKAFTTRLQDKDSTIGRLMTDPTLAQDLRDAVGNVKAFTVELKSGQGTLGRLINDPRLYDDARATVASLKAAADRIDRALGRDANGNVVGLLLTDPKMAEELKRSVKALSDFLEAQRENAPLTTFAGLLFKPF